MQRSGKDFLHTYTCIYIHLYLYTVGAKSKYGAQLAKVAHILKVITTTTDKIESSRIF
jgi:hypothetical protein